MESTGRLASTDDKGSDRTFENFTMELRDVVAVITLNREDKHNSLTKTFWGELEDALAIVAKLERVRVILLTGMGERAFSAGGDIRGFAELRTSENAQQYQVDAMAGFAAIEACGIPVIAVVNGYALGGGCELAIACDIVIASENARFGLPESRVGLVPGYGVTRSAATIGLHWSKWLVFTGEIIDAFTAERIGLVQRVVPQATLMEVAMEVADKIAAQAPLAVSAGKWLINASASRTESDRSIGALTELHATADALEGLRAFSEKRKPLFEGR